MYCSLHFQNISPTKAVCLSYTIATTSLFSLVFLFTLLPQNLFLTHVHGIFYYAIMTCFIDVFSIIPLPLTSMLSLS